MREHMGIFRGKRIDNGEWLEGAYCKHDTVEVCFTTDDPKTKHLIVIDGFCDWGLEPSLVGHEVDPNTIGECTGLKDKNGKLIFEGDLLRYYVESGEDKRAGIAVINFGRFKDTDALSDFDHLGWYLTIPMFTGEATTIFALEENGIAVDIIGNIYDDAEVNAFCGATNLPCIKCSAGPCSSRKCSDNPELLKGGECE